MKLYTSYFGRASREPNAVAISRGIPKWYNGRRYIELAPLPHLIKEQDREKFTREYYRTCLYKLNPEFVAKELGDGAIMLCWEKPEDFCHRQVVAEWMRREAGIDVSEWDPRPIPEFKNVKKDSEQIELF